MAGADRRRAARRHRPRRGRIKFVLARGDFRDREIERGRAERRRGTIDLGGGALDHLGLALLVLQLGLLAGCRVRDLRQPRVEARDGVVQLPGDARFAARARRRCAGASLRGAGLRNLLDLAGDRIQPLMDIGDVAAFPGSASSAADRGALRKLGGAESPRVELSQSFSDMPARRAAASALSRTDGSMPSTLHDTREFMLSSGSDFGAPPAPSASPRVPVKRQSNSAQVVCLRTRLFRVTVNNRLRNGGWPAPESCLCAGTLQIPGPVRPSSVVSRWLPSTARRLRRRRQTGIERLFAPLRHGTLMTKADAKREQLADIRRRSGAVREALVENAFVAGEPVAVVFQPRHQVGAQRARCRRCRARKAAPADRP